MMLAKSMDAWKRPKPCSPTSLAISNEFAGEFWSLANSSPPEKHAAARDELSPQWWRLPSALVDGRPQRTTSTPMPTLTTAAHQGGARGTSLVLQSVGGKEVRGGGVPLRPAHSSLAVI